MATIEQRVAQSERWQAQAQRRPAQIEVDPCTDTANAARFADLYRDELRFVEGIGWYHWSGRCWQHAPLIADRLAQDLGNHIRAEAADHLNSMRIQELSKKEHQTLHEQASALLKWAKASEASARIEAVLKRSESRLQVKASHLDADPWLLNVKNGTIDLRTGELRDACREDLITRCSPVCYEPHVGEKPDVDWHQTVLQICCGDEDLAGYLQRVMGYCLTGITREQAMFLFNGSGANGKDTILTHVAMVMGDYAGLAAPGLLMSSWGDRHPTEVADLRGMRLAISSETGEQGKLNETLVKQLTGSQRLKGRFMRQDFFEFDAQFKLVLMTNHRPVIEGTDYAIWRRLQLVPFNQKFIAGVNRDETLWDKIQAQALPAILRWCVTGCLMWQRDGLRPPEIVKRATAEYRQDQDVLAQFLEERCTSNRHAQVTASALFRHYQEWCQDNGEQSRSQKWLWLKLQDRGISKERTSSGVLYRGIGLENE